MRCDRCNTEPHLPKVISAPGETVRRILACKCGATVRYVAPDDGGGLFTIKGLTNLLKGLRRWRGGGA